MHYRKLLKKLIDEMLPDWRDKFLSYKDLKQQLTQIYPRDDRGNKRRKLITHEDGGINSMAVAKEVADFVKSCQQQTDKLNDFVLEKQEWYVIIIKVLEGNLVAAKDSSEELMKVAKQLADLHGEIVLLLNYSALNYTGLVKILKKHDKLSGAIVRVPFIQKVMNEPFYETDVLNDLAKKCNAMIGQILCMNESYSCSLEMEMEMESSATEPIRVTVADELVDIKNMENTYMNLTISALRVLAEIRNGSSTINMFSLPPM